jgi:hypothetical protein
MESHNKIRKNIPTLWNRNQELIVDRIRKQWGYSEYTEEEVHTVCGILEVNSFEVGTNGNRARALFPEAYLICHDCQPNTTHTDDTFTHKLHLRTAVPLKKGDKITLSYSYTLQVSTAKHRTLRSNSLQRILVPFSVISIFKILVSVRCVFN